MTSFMGPMAPPPAAPAQPQALDIRTDPNQRQQFKQFMRQRTSMAPMVSAPIAQPQPPMPVMQSPAMFNMGGGVDIFDPMYSAPMMAPSAPMGFKEGGSTQPIEQRVMKNGQIGLFRGQTFLGFKQEPEKKEESPLLSLAKFKEVLGFEDGGSVPPRRTDIRGQDHMLSYITPDEADILKALGGSGEAGPMGIPAYRPGGDDGQGNVGGDAPGGDVGTAGDGMGEGQGQGAGQGMGGVGDPSDDNASDDDMGDVGVMDGPGYSGPDDTDSVDVATDQENAAEIAGQMAADRAARDRAVRDAFATTTSGKPIGTKSGYLSKESATDEQIAAGYKALGLPDPNSDLASQDVEASYGVPTSIASVSGVPTDPLSSSNKGLLLGLNPQDLLAIENFSYAPPAQTNVSLSRNPKSAITSVSAPTSKETDQLLGIFSQGLPSVSNLDDFDMIADLQTTAPVASAPSSNVVSDFSPTPADQLADVYGIDLDALNAAVDDPNAAMGARGPTATDASAGIGYDPVTDMPFGLEFGTNPQTGAQITTNLAGLTEQQQKDQPFSMDVAQFIGSKPYGYEIDPQTGQVIGQVGTPPMGILGSLTNLAQNLFMGPPETVQDLIDRGAYTGMTGQGDGGEGGDGPDQPVKAPTDPCPDGFVMKNGACTPIETGSGFPNQIGGMTPPTNAPAPVIVPSSRFPGYSLQGPVGYGSPIAGQAAPSVASNAAMYQQMLQGMRPPLRLEDGGAVPPRNVEISGQDHMLSYITPDEADILKSLGGSGKPGPMGIPSFEGDATPYQRGKSFYRVPVGTFGGGPDDMQFKKVYIGSNQDTMENRQLGSSSLASATQDMPGPIPQAVNRDEYLRQYERDLAALQGRPDPYPDPVSDPEDPVVDDAIITDPAPPDPNAYNPIMDVVVPSTRLQDFPASAPPASTQPMPFQGPVGYGSPIAGQGPGSINPLLSGGINPLYSNALNFQNMLGQPFPLKLQQGGAVSSNLDMAADNFLKALMPAA
jgi:hypothetical protein